MCRTKFSRIFGIFIQFFIDTYKATVPGTIKYEPTNVCTWYCPNGRNNNWRIKLNATKYNSIHRMFSNSFLHPSHMIPACNVNRADRIRQIKQSEKNLQINENIVSIWIEHFGSTFFVRLKLPKSSAVICSFILTTIQECVN